MSSSRRADLRYAVASAAIGVSLLLLSARAAGPRFYKDDPLVADNDTAFDASGAKPRDLPPRRFTDNTTTVPKKFMAARRRRALTGAARENGSAAKAKALRANVREIAFGT